MPGSCNVQRRCWRTRVTGTRDRWRTSSVTGCKSWSRPMPGYERAPGDALFADQGRLDDPHVWPRAERLGLGVGLGVERCEATDARTRCVTASKMTSGVG
jgi:hypothetical protein